MDVLDARVPNSFLRLFPSNFDDLTTARARRLPVVASKTTGEDVRREIREDILILKRTFIARLFASECVSFFEEKAPKDTRETHFLCDIYLQLSLSSH